MIMVQQAAERELAISQKLSADAGTTTVSQQQQQQLQTQRRRQQKLQRQRISNQEEESRQHGNGHDGTGPATGGDEVSNRRAATASMRVFFWGGWGWLIIL
jgi:hypothetical protein